MLKPEFLHLCLSAAAILLPLVPSAAAAPPKATVAKTDLANQVEGTYSGDVISDSRGSSRSDVSITVTKVGPNRIHVTSDYSRLPAFEANLVRYMQSIQNTGGEQVFLVDTAKKPPSLDITVDEASWSGRKEQ
jgi:hypothetical protein